MTRPRPGRGRVTNGRALHPTTRGQVVTMADRQRMAASIANLQRIRWTDCEHPDCPKTGTRHAEELCDDCSIREGKPVYHLVE